MNTELLGSIAQIVLMVVLAYRWGSTLQKFIKGEDLPGLHRPGGKMDF